MASKKYNKLVNKIKKKETHRYREQTSGYYWGEGSGEGQYRVGDEEIQTIRYKISYKDILYNTGNTVNILFIYFVFIYLFWLHWVFFF